MITLVMSAEFTGKGAGPARAIAIQMASYANDQGKAIWPSINRLAKETGFDDKTCRKAVHKLIADRILRVTQDANTNPKRKTPTYEFSEDWIKKHDRSGTAEPEHTTRHSPFNYTTPNGRTVTFQPSQRPQPPKEPQPLTAAPQINALIDNEKDERRKAAFAAMLNRYRNDKETTQ
ncbi:MAG TPA: helix-turn-helix domain-containing protein [Oculatellaceae cyanobacterium]